MVLSWPVRDALSQVEAVVARKVALDGGSGADGKSTPRSNTQLNPFTVSANSLTATDVTLTLRLLQQWLQKTVSPTECAETFEFLQGLAQKYDSHDQQVATKSNAPSTTDKKETVDDKTDKSVTFYILETMTKIFSAILSIDNQQRPQDLLPFDDRRGGTVATCYNAVPFAFGYLSHDHSPGVRHAAGRLMGALSNEFLQQCAEAFMEKYKSCKKDDDKRQFATIQRAVGFLEFGVSTEEQAHTTNEYLADLALQMKSIDRGILRQEICQSLSDIFTRILSLTDFRHKISWEAFAESGGKEFDAFNLNYMTIYERVAKWSTKSKHSVFCWDLMMRMVVLSRNPDFFNDKKRMDVYAAVLKGFGSKDTRLDCMNMMSKYVRDVNPAFLNTDPDKWNKQVNSLLTTIYPNKSSKPVDEEIPILTELTVVAGRKGTSALRDLIKTMLQPNSPYYTRQKAIALKALGEVAKEKQSEVRELGPLLAPLIEDNKETADDKQVLVLRAALTCWPHVRSLDAAKVSQTAAAVVPMTLHDDRDIASLAAICLSEYILIDAKSNFFPTMHALIDLLAACDPALPVNILKTCNNLTVVLQALIDSQKAVADAASGENGSPTKAAAAAAAAPKPFVVNGPEWTILREHLESVSLVRLCHPEGWVRTEVLRLLLRFNTPELNKYESKVSNNSPKLIDSLLPNVSNSDNVVPTTESFFLPLKRVITLEYDRFSGIINHAFSLLHKSVDSLTVLDEKSAQQNDEWLNLFKPSFLFLALTVRPSADVNQSLPGAAPAAAAAASAARASTIATLERQGSLSMLNRAGPIATGVGSAELSAKFNEKQTRLNQNLVNGNDVRHFFETVVSFLQSPHQGSLLYTLRLSIAHDLAEVHPTVYTVLVDHLRFVLKEPVQVDPKKPVKQVNPKTAFYYHEHTLDVIERILIRIQPDEYHRGPTLLSKTVDDLIIHWSADNAEFFVTLSARIRCYVASILTRYLALRYPHKQHSAHAPRQDILNRRPFFFKLLTSLSKGVDGTKADAIELESALLSGVAALIALGPFHDIQTGNNVLSFLESQLTPHCPAHIAERVTLCFQLFFHINAARLNDLIRFSLSEVHDPNGPYFIPHGSFPVSRAAAGTISRFYVKALFTAWTTEFKLWNESISTSEMLIVSLLHMNSNDLEVRTASLILAQFVLKQDQIDLEDHIHLFSPTAAFMYSQSTLTLGEFLANNPHYLTSLPAVFKRIEELISSCLDNKKEILVRILTPFVAQYPEYIRYLESQNLSNDQINNALTELFSSLFSITRTCYVPILATAIRDMWMALLKLEPVTEAMIAYALHWTIDAYASLLDDSSSSSSAISQPPLTRPLSTSIAPPMSPLSKFRPSLSGTIPPISRPSSMSINAGSDEHDQLQQIRAEAAAAASSDSNASTPSSTPIAAPRTVSTEHLSTPAASAAPAAGLSDGHEKRPAAEILTEKSILRMIITYLARTQHSQLILLGLIDHLRDYKDEAPLEPNQFVTWLSERTPLNEPVIQTERAAFELVVNSAYEQQPEVLIPLLPRMLLNAYVLFPGSQLSDELLRNIALTLKMLDSSASSDVVINESFFVYNLSVKHPQLRADFSTAAFRWSIHSRDSAISTQAYRLFNQLEFTFYFGEKQHTLIRIILYMYASLKNKDFKKLRSIVSTLTLPTEHAYDQAGWSALLVSGSALLSFSDITLFTQGLTLLKHLFASDINKRRKRAWIVQLGPFMANSATAKKGDAAVDQTAVELLQKGLYNTVTVEDTVNVLSSLADLYTATDRVPPANNVIALAMLMNVLLRGVELARESDKAKGVDLTPAQQLVKNKNQVRGVDALATLSLVLFATAAEDEQHSAAWTALANIFKNTAIAWSSTLPSPAEGKVAENDSAAAFEVSRTALMGKLSSIMETGPLVQVGALSGSNVPSLTQLCVPFFKQFAAIYSSQEHFDVVISFFTRILHRCVSEWRYTLLMMIGRFLLETPHLLNTDQFSALTDCCTFSYLSSDHNEQALAENLAYLLITKKGRGEIKATDAFNMVRPRSALKRPAPSTTSLAADEKVDAEAELSEALNRIERSVFSLLQTMIDEPREYEAAPPQAQRELRVPPQPTVLAAATTAATVASSGDEKAVDALVIAGCHAAKPFVLDKTLVKQQTPPATPSRAVARTIVAKTPATPAPALAPTVIADAGTVTPVTVLKPAIVEPEPVVAAEPPAAKANPFEHDGPAAVPVPIPARKVDVPATVAAVNNPFAADDEGEGEHKADVNGAKANGGEGEADDDDDHVVAVVHSTPAKEAAAEGESTNPFA